MYHADLLLYPNKRSICKHAENQQKNKLKNKMITN